MSGTESRVPQGGGLRGNNEYEVRRMKVNRNIGAVIVNEQLLRNENKLSESLQRLSSGFKFNSAKDNPSGVAISFKMQAQINGLNRASANVTDGTSIVETIDASIGEMTSVLQRMRELCVQAANDTNTQKDKEAIQLEIDALKDEVDRISSDTEFNGKKLLDGTLDRRTYVTGELIDKTTPPASGTTPPASVPIMASLHDQIENIIVSDEVQAEHYKVQIESNAKHAVARTTVQPDPKGTPTASGEPTIGASGTVWINGSKIEIKEDMTMDEVYKALRDGGDVGGVNVFAYDSAHIPLQSDPPTEATLDSQGLTQVPFQKNGSGYPCLAFVSEKYGSSQKIEIFCEDDDDSANKLSEALKLDVAAGNISFEDGKDVTASIEDPKNKGAYYSTYTDQAVVKSEGDRVIITDRSGFEISFEVRSDMEHKENLALPAGMDPREIDIEVTDIGTLQLQIGGNEDQELEVRVPVLNTRSLYIEDVDVTEINGASRGIAEMDVALGIVSAARSKMGAYENSLDYAQNSLDSSVEDMTKAISRLGDTDMAQEMTTYSSANVLNQASISILAQANDLPQQVLSLLQG